MIANRSRSAGEAVTRQMLRHWQEAVPNGRLAHLVKHAARGVARALQMRLTEHSVTYGHWTFLRILWEAEGLTQRQLSDEAGVMEPTTFSALNAMEKLGYVARRPRQTKRKEVPGYLNTAGSGLQLKRAPSARRRRQRGRPPPRRPRRRRGDATDAARAHCEPGGRQGRIARAAPAYPVDAGIVALAQRFPRAHSQNSAAPPCARWKVTASPQPTR